MGSDSRGGEAVRKQPAASNVAAAEPRIAWFLVAERSRSKQKAALIIKKIIEIFVLFVIFGKLF